MRRIELTPDQMKAAGEIVRQGGGIFKLAASLNVSRAVATRIRDEINAATGRLPSQKHHTQESRKVVEAQIRDVYSAALKEASRLAAQITNVVEWTAPDNPPLIGLACLADIHGGDQGTNYDAYERDRDLILKTPGLYAVLAGDAIDNHIRIVAATVAARMSPALQWQWLAKELDTLRPKLIAILSGNHEAWTAAMTGFDPLAHLASLVHTPYDRDEIELRLAVGRATYIGCVRHKYRFNSSYNASHAVKQLWRFGAVDFDFGILGHNHESTVEPFVGHGRTRWVARPSTYQVRSRYAAQEGYHGGPPVTPVLLFRRDTRDMLGVASIEWAAEIMRGINKGRR